MISLESLWEVAFVLRHELLAPWTTAWRWPWLAVWALGIALLVSDLFVPASAMARWRRYFVRAAVASHALFVAAALGMVEFGRQRRIDIAIQGRGDRPVRSLRWLESLEWGTLCWCGALGGVAALGWTFWVSERVRDRGAGYSGAAIWGSGLMLACAFWTASAFIVDIDHRATADFPRYAQYWASFDTLNQVRNTRGSLLVVALLTWLFCILRAMRGPARAEGPQKAKLIGSCAFMLTGIAIQIQAQSWDEDTDTWLQPPPPGVAVVDGYDQPSLETCVRPRYDNSDTAPQRLYVRSGGPVHWEGTEMSDEQLDRFLAWNRDRSLWGHAPHAPDSSWWPTLVSDCPHLPGCSRPCAMVESPKSSLLGERREHSTRISAAHTQRRHHVERSSPSQKRAPRSPSTRHGGHSRPPPADSGRPCC